MPRLCLIVAGSPSDHRLVSDSLSDEEFKSQLATVADSIGSVERIRLPWATAKGSSVLAAEKIDDSPADGGAASWR